MRSQTILQVGLGVALVAGSLSMAAAAEQPSSDKDMVLSPRGGSPWGVTSIQTRRGTRSCSMRT